MTAVVVGGTRGIGLAISRELSKRGHAVAMNYISNDAAAQDALKLMSGPAKVIKGDAAEPADVKRLYDQAETLGPIEIIVHSAVVPLLGGAITAKIEDFDTAYRTGPRAFLIMVQEAAPRMKNGGHIIAVGSIASGPRFVTGYGILGPAKCAVDHLVAQLGCELAAQGIRINCVATSTIEGHFVKTHPKSEKMKQVLTAKTPAGRIGTEEDVARAVALLCSADADWIVGQTITADGGMALVL